MEASRRSLKSPSEGVEAATGYGDYIHATGYGRYIDESGATCSAGCKLPHTLVEFTTQLTELHKLDKMDRLVVETKSEGIINTPNWINKDCS